MKQSTLFGGERARVKSSKYSDKIEAPIYQPKNTKPSIFALYDSGKTLKLKNEIQNTDLPADEKKFLLQAAERHTVFNYEKIADYYAHSNKGVQDLMEKSGLVIVDFDKAVKYGFVKLCEEIRGQYLEEYE